MKHPIHFVTFSSQFDALERMEPESPERVLELVKQMYQEWEDRRQLFTRTFGVSPREYRKKK